MTKLARTLSRAPSSLAPALESLSVQGRLLISESALCSQLSLSWGDWGGGWNIGKNSRHRRRTGLHGNCTNKSTNSLGVLVLHNTRQWTNRGQCEGSKNKRNMTGITPLCFVSFGYVSPESTKQEKCVLCDSIHKSRCVACDVVLVANCVP